METRKFKPPKLARTAQLNCLYEFKPVTAGRDWLTHRWKRVEVDHEILAYWPKKKNVGEIKISIRKRNDLIDVEWQQIENDLRNLDKWWLLKGRFRRYDFCLWPIRARLANVMTFDHPDTRNSTRVLRMSWV